MTQQIDREPVNDWHSDLDHFDPEFVADPYPIYEDLRGQCPVAHSDRYGGMTWLTKASDVAAAANATETFSSRRTIISEIPTDRRGLVLPPINIDPPEHTEHRRLLLPFFTPKATAEWEPTIREICSRLLNGLDGQTEFDAAVEYAQEIPGDVTARMLGVSLEDTPQFREWLHDLLEVGPTNPTVQRETTTEMMDYLLQLTRERRADHKDGDVVQYLLDQRMDGEELSDDEIAKTLFLLLIAGVDTTWSAIGSSLLHLATHPEEQLATPQVQSFFRFGASPRAAQTLVLAGKVRALLDGRTTVSYDDIRASALPALRHRCMLNFEAEAEGVQCDDILQNLIDTLPTDIQ